MDIGFTRRFQYCLPWRPQSLAVDADMRLVPNFFALKVAIHSINTYNDNPK
jgi:hypothetical protein